MQMLKGCPTPERAGIPGILQKRTSGISKIVQVNNTQVVVDRGNRPNVSQRVGLRTYFINDGAYVDPYEISSVQLFTRSAHPLSPYTVS